jgi:nucleoid DNA-binding protein
LEFKGLPNIEEYLASRGDGSPVEANDLDHIVDAVCAYCGFTKEQSQRILCLFFQEIRNAMLAGDIVDIRGLGSFFISSPKVTSNKERVFPKFKAKKSFSRRLNHG